MHGYGCPHAFQNIQGFQNIAHIGNVVNGTGSAGQNRGVNNGQGSVFHAADGDGAVELLTASDVQAVHLYLP